MDDCNLCMRHGKERRKEDNTTTSKIITKKGKMITTYFFSFLLGNHLSTVIRGIFLVSNALLNIKNALNTVCVGIFLFPSEEKINHNKCSIACGDCRGTFCGKPCKRLQQRCRKQVRRKWTSKIRKILQPLYILLQCFL